MNMYKAIIVDDEKLNAELLFSLIQDFIPELEVICICLNMVDALKVINDNDDLIIFLDIELGSEYSGFDLLKIIKNETHNVIVVSAYPKYALEAFRASTIDFLLKPLRISELIESVEKIKRKVEVEKELKNLRVFGSQSVTIQLLNKFTVVSREEIIFVKSNDNRTQIVLSNGELLMSLERIGDVNLKLADLPFFRVHQSYIVNLNYISAITKLGSVQFVELQKKYEVPIARRKKKQLFSLIAGK